MHESITYDSDEPHSAEELAGWFAAEADPRPLWVYRWQFGWDARPAFHPTIHGPGTVACQCRQGAACATPGKHPASRWKGVEPSYWELREQQRWHHNICLLTGTPSGVLVGDVDPRHGGKIETLWERGWPQDTPISETGGGYHVFVQCPASGVRSLDKYAQGVEIKADGRILILPPSLHPSDRRYRWMPGHAPWEVALAALPAALLASLEPAPGPVLVTPPMTPPAQPRAPGEPDYRDDPDLLAYSVEDTLRLATALYWKFVKRARAGEGRNNMCYRLGRQLDSLGMTRAEVTVWARQFAREVDRG